MYLNVVLPVSTSRLRVRAMLLGLIALFLTPLVAAVLLVGHWRPQAHAEHGELLDPARPLPVLALHELDGSSLSEQPWQHRWTLVYIAGDAQCAKTCQAALYRLRQVQIATGRDSDRVQRLALWPQTPTGLTADWLAREHGGLRSVLLSRDQVRPLTDAWSVSGVPGGWIYLVDPLGNLLLRYPAEGDASGMLSDLTRLLKLSKIG